MATRNLVMTRTGTFEVNASLLTEHQCASAGNTRFEYTVSLEVEGVSLQSLDENGFLMDNAEVGVYFQNTYGSKDGDRLYSCEITAMNAADYFWNLFNGPNNYPRYFQHHTGQWLRIDAPDRMGVWVTDENRKWYKSPLPSSVDISDVTVDPLARWAEVDASLQPPSRPRLKRVTVRIVGTNNTHFDVTISDDAFADSGATPSAALRLAA